MKKLLTLVAMLAALLATSAPAFAQEITLEFELAVEGKPPADATFWGQYLVEGATVPLEDPDGDGVYTGSMSGGRTEEGAGFRIVQGTGTERLATGLYPGEPVTILKNFGAQPVAKDTTFSASVSFEEDSATEAQYTTTPAVSDDSDSPNASSPNSDDLSVLPDTGGFSPAIFGLVALLLLSGGGLLAYRSTHR
ncbi:hypothetical protein BH24ACT22_BH24ACT22_10320 [soil metagenome]